MTIFFKVLSYGFGLGSMYGMDVGCELNFGQRRAVAVPKQIIFKANSLFN